MKLPIHFRDGDFATVSYRFNPKPDRHLSGQAEVYHLQIPLKLESDDGSKSIYRVAINTNPYLNEREIRDLVKARRERK